jgi:dihydropteroate synthase
MTSGCDEVWARQSPALMGIINVTPDSFADAGCCLDRDAAIAQGLRLVGEGADCLDIGGESSRPGAASVAASLEAERVVPVIAELSRLLPRVPISVDTTKPEVAALALKAGATIVNDITAARSDGMLELISSRGAAVILMHMRGTPASMQHDTGYADVVAEVHSFLLARARAAVAAGIPPGRVWLDPGIGFGKDLEGNLRLIAALPDLAALGHPVVLGASRKSFIGKLTGAPVGDRLPGSLAALAGTARLGHAVVRVHDVAATAQFLAVLKATRRVA